MNFINNFFWAPKQALEIENKTLNEKEVISIVEKSAGTTLKLINCMITESVVKAIANKKNLKEISFKNCSKLTDEHIQNIANIHKSSLEVFSVKGPSRVTEEIWNILSCVDNLHSISLSDIPIEKESHGYLSFLNAKKDQLTKLSCNLGYSNTPADEKIELPKLQKFTWFQIKNSDLEFLKKTSPNLIKLKTCALSFKENHSNVWEQIPLLSKFSLYKPSHISLNDSTPVNGIKKQTSQINAATIDPEGFSIFTQSFQGNTRLVKINMTNGTETIIDTSVPYLIGSSGVMSSVQGDKAIIATTQQNEKNTEPTNITVIDLVSNKPLFELITIPPGSSVYDVQMGSFSKNSTKWAYATEINSNNQPYLVDQIKLHVFPIESQYKQQTITLDYFSPVQHQGKTTSTFINQNEIALIAYGSGGSCVFCCDLATGTTPKKYVVPVNPNKINGGFTAITRVFDRKYSMAVMDARGDIYIGPASNSNQFILEASMGDLFNSATFYTSFVYVGNGIFAFYSETQYPYIANQRLVGFFDIDNKKKLLETPIKVDSNCDFYLKEMRLLDSGKLGLNIVSGYLKDNKEPTWSDNFVLDIPKKN